MRFCRKICDCTADGCHKGGVVNVALSGRKRKLGLIETAPQTGEPHHIVGDILKMLRIISLTDYHILQLKSGRGDGIAVLR